MTKNFASGSIPVFSDSGILDAADEGVLIKVHKKYFKNLLVKHG
jgi:hypothetical protein